MPKIIVLFNLKPGTDEAAYEAWARQTDLPTVRGLASIDGFEVFRATGLLGSDAPSPYRYIEQIDVNDIEQFGDDVGQALMQRVAAEFQAFAHAPVFIMCHSIE